MHASVDSLNVAAATAIFLYKFAGTRLGTFGSRNGDSGLRVGNASCVYTDMPQSSPSGYPFQLSIATPVPRRFPNSPEAPRKTGKIEKKLPFGITGNRHL